MSRPTLAVTSGEPAGIGPELCRFLAGQDFGARLVVLGDRDLILASSGVAEVAGHFEIAHVPLRVPAQPGQLNSANSPYVLELLDRAIDGCQSGAYAAMVTAPVHKGVINAAGIPFTGHTEYLAERAHTPRVVMMLAGGGLRVALVTTHLPLAAVPAAITADAVTETLRITVRDLRQKFGIERPRVLVCGLNPHAGESGYLGREEIDVISPALATLRAEGLDVVGPLPADTLFTARVLAGSDAQVAMFHDQGLAVLKYASFGHGINVTLGLPFIRTSVDHGTALDLAGRGAADPGSLCEAVTQAVAMARRRMGRSRN